MLNSPDDRKYIFTKKKLLPVRSEESWVRPEVVNSKPEFLVLRICN